MMLAGRPAATSLLLACAAAALVLATTEQVFAQLNEHCTVSVLNRSVRVNPDGSWLLPNVPAATGQVKARATCVENGQTRSGESDFFVIRPNRMNAIPPIVFGSTTQVPSRLTITQGTATLSTAGETLQLSVEATYPNTTTRNVTTANTGTNYTTSNAAIADVSGDGLVTGFANGTVVVQASNDGTPALATIRVLLSTGDSDGDGMPDEWELEHGFNPNLPIDAEEDPDRDGLINRLEFGAGTDPRAADTDADLLNDGQEIARGTNPLAADTDGDGIGDGLEVQAGTLPLDPASFNLNAALLAIRVTPASFLLTFNTILGEASRQLTVTGDMRDGRTIDVTARGTNYNSTDLTVCGFGATPGRVFAGETGSCTITATVAGFTATSIGAVRTFSPTALGSIQIPGYANNVDANGRFAYVAAGGAGLVVVDVAAPATPQIVATLDTPGNANDVRVVGNFAYVADGTAGLQIIDVTDPAAPQIVGALDTAGEANDVIVSGAFAFVADGASGVQIIDVSDRSAPALVKTVATAGFARGVDVNGTTLVVVTDFPDPGLSVIDPSDIANAAIAGSVILNGQPIDVSLQNGFAYVAAYTGGMVVVDVRNSAAPVVTGSLDSSSFVPRDVQAAGQFAIFTDQLFTNAVAPIVNVSDASNPQFVDVLDFGGDFAGTGIAVSGPYVYWTGQSFFVGDENGTTGDTRLMIGQYFSLEDTEGIAPAVTLTAPADGTTVLEGETVTVRATATDDIAVAAVIFSRDGQDVFVDTSAPFEYSLVAPTGVSSITLGAVAVDLGGNTATADRIGINVIPDPLTTVTGRVVDEEGAPVAGATVSVLGRSATTGPDGRFTIPGVPTVQPTLIVRASLNRDGTVLTGFSAPMAPVRGGTTAVGDIVARATTFEQELGTRHDCDWCDLTVPLPFAFPIAGGTRTSIHVSNGYVWTDEGDTIELLCCSMSVDANDPTSATYVNTTLPGRVVVTWLNMRTSGGGGLAAAQKATTQLVLFDDGRIQYGYREVDVLPFWQTGLFPASATSQRQIDFRASQTQTVAANESVYENFFSPSQPFDLGGGFVVFTPNAAQGYDLRTVPDLVPPMCTITPAPGATLFRGEHLSIEAFATDNGLVRNVLLQSSVGGVNADLTQPPYRASFVVPLDATTVTITATAFDSWSNSGSCISTVNVIDGPPPTSTMTLPGAPTVATAGQTLWVSVDAANRVPVTRVDLIANGATIATDTAAPFDFAFAVPSGMASLTLNTIATDFAGHTGTTTEVTLGLLADPLTTVGGIVVDRDDVPINGATVTLLTQGVSAEIFDFLAPLTALPDMTGPPNRTRVLTGFNLRNPGLVFGSDPFGLGAAAAHAIRYSATLNGTTAGTYTFTLGVGGGGRLIVNGEIVVDLPTATGQFQQATGSRELTGGPVSLQVLTFDNGNPEFQLSYGLNGTEYPVHINLVTPAISPYQATSRSDGTFAIDDVKTVLGDITASARAVVEGRTLNGRSPAVAPVGAGITDVGRIRLAGGRIGLLHCDSAGAIRAAMLATGLVTNDELVERDVCGTPPTLAQLSELGSVLVWSNFPFGQRDALGDVLADYVDQGGGVVLATYAFSQPWAVGGRIATANYTPFLVSDNRRDTANMLDLAASNTAHPIMAGVPAGPYFENQNYVNPDLTPGASLIAVDTQGNRVVAVKGRIVGISIFPGFGDMGRLFTNAVLFVR